MKAIVVASLLVAWVAGAPVALWAAEQPADKPAETQKAPKAKTRPYRGTIKAFDKAAMSFTLEGPKGDTIYITSQTRLWKEGQPTTTEAIAVGERVTGQARQTAEGKWEAVSVYLGQPAQRKGQTGDKGKDVQKKQGQPETK